MDEIQNIVFEKLTSSYLDRFVELRVKQLKEEGAKEKIDIRPNLIKYYNKHLNDKSFIAWIALLKGEIIGTIGIAIVEKPPYFGNETGKIGLLSSMYVKKEFRRNGLASKLLNMIVEESKNQGLKVIQITASKEGVLLYTNFGFKKNDRFMQYDL